MRVLDPEIGDRFGRLTVVGVAERRGYFRYFSVLCDCGTEKEVYKGSLTSGATTSCGCLKGELTSQRSKTHGMADTRAYNCWKGMKTRCLNLSNSAFEGYGGRGIEICERWLSFENFLADLGEPPLGYSLDRIDTNGNYELSNCRWTDVKAQNDNRRNAIRYLVHSEVLSIREASEKYNINEGTLNARICVYGMTMEEAVAMPAYYRHGLPKTNKRVDGFFLYPKETKL